MNKNISKYSKECLDPVQIVVLYDFYEFQESHENIVFVANDDDDDNPTDIRKNES